MSMTLRRNVNPDQPAADGQPPEAETKMRRALGLLPSAGPLPSGGARVRPRGGDGPVVEHRGDRHGGSAINRVAAAEAALAEERHAREQLARQLRDADAALREAQTKRGHAELARDEALAALAAERAAREAAEQQVRNLSTAPPLPPAAESDVEAASSPPQRAARGYAAAAPDPAVPAKRRGRPPGSVSKTKRAPATKARQPEAQDSAGPVEWWVPGWQERI